MKKQKENSREGITWSEMGKQNVQAEKVYYHVSEKLISIKGTGVNLPWRREFLLIQKIALAAKEVRQLSVCPSMPVGEICQASFKTTKG